jgi:hypothetical protein
MKRAVESAKIPDDAPAELKHLHAIALEVTKSQTVEDLKKHGERLQFASDAVRSLSDAHFADRKHSHGPGE